MCLVPSAVTGGGAVEAARASSLPRTTKRLAWTFGVNVHDKANQNQFASCQLHILIAKTAVERTFVSQPAPQLHGRTKTAQQPGPCGTLRKTPTPHCECA